MNDDVAVGAGSGEKAHTSQTVLTIVDARNTRVVIAARRGAGAEVMAIAKASYAHMLIGIACRK